MDDREDFRTIASEAAAKVRDSADIRAVVAAAQMRLKPTLDLAQRLKIPSAASAMVEMVSRMERERNQQWLAMINAPRIAAVEAAQRLAEKIAAPYARLRVLEAYGAHVEKNEDWLDSATDVADPTPLPTKQPSTDQGTWDLERELRNLRAECQDKTRRLVHVDRIYSMTPAEVRSLANIGDTEARQMVALMDMEASQRGSKAAKARHDSRYGPCIELTYRLVRDRVPASGRWSSQRQARLAVEDDVVASPEGRKIGLSKDQAEKTIGRWVREMPGRDEVIRSKPNRKSNS
ncbi:hypothetical protein D3C87_1410640 [compost metagenome]